MSFSERAKLTALAIVNIFETGKPLGDFSAVAVLNDGAGVSYGINQFTHRSGSLRKVIVRYLELGGTTAKPVLEALLPTLRDTTTATIAMVSRNIEFKTALKAAGRTWEMQLAQQQIADECYLRPAIEACEGSDFVYPLSLAVIYDSMNHGSYQKIRDRVTFRGPGNGSITPEEFEREWIAQYVTKRDAWLESIPRLARTDYRTDFFLAQIARGNWELDMPMNVHGFRLTAAHIDAAITIKEPTRETPTRETNARRNAAAEGQPTVIPQEPQSDPAPATIAGTNYPAGTPAEHEAQPPQPAAETTVTVDAPEPTGFMSKLKTQGAALVALIGGSAGLKEWLGIELRAETAELLKILLPTVLGLGFVGFLVWFVAEKVIGWKTLRLQADIATDPTRHNLKINPK